MDVSELLPWVERLTNLDVTRCEKGLAELSAWRLDHVHDELLEEPDVDTIVAGVLLAEAVGDLSAQGVDRQKLMKKLRDAKMPDQLWSTWAEIRSAAILIGHPDIDVQLAMEPDRRRGRHADFRLIYPDGEHTEIEFKAVGLSSREVDWHQRAADHFEVLLPPIGLGTVHGALDQPIRYSQAKRARAFKKSKQLARDLRKQFPAWADVRGIAIVGHETEPEYLRRARGRIESALGQLSTDAECWVALWWGNGAPIQSAPGLLASVNAPPNVAGIAFIGQAVSVPWSEISIFIVPIERGAPFDEVRVESTVNDDLATRVLERFESSSGIRPTLLRAPEKDGVTLLRRDGRRRIFPFNLLFDADPRRLAAPHRQPSPVQDSQILD